MYIFFGASGAGKSMQGNLLATKTGLPWVATGELLRAHTSKRNQRHMLKGDLLNDRSIIHLVDQAIDETPDHNCILDGFPRTQHQAEWLLEQVDTKHFAIDAVIVLDVSVDTVNERLQARGRPDDNEEAIERRYKTYHDKTEPLIELMENAGIRILRINGEATVEDVSRAINKALKI